MSNLMKMKSIILSVLQDGEVHLTDEILQKAIDSGVGLGEKNQTMRNALYALRKNGMDIVRKEGTGYQWTNNRVNFEENDNKDKGVYTEENMSSLDRMINTIENEMKIIKSVNWTTDPIEKIIECREKIDKLSKIKNILMGLESLRKNNV